jgi:hypothetical protein
MDLDAFLLRHRPTLRFTRIFYVVKPHLEGRNWCKIGVASGSSPEAAYSRLRAYTVLYGKRSSATSIATTRSRRIRRRAGPTSSRGGRGRGGRGRGTSTETSRRSTADGTAGERRRSTAGNCRGVRIYLCWCVRYDGAVDPTHTRTHALELALKRLFKAEGHIVQAADRGSERVHLSPAKVVAAALRLMPHSHTQPRELPASRRPPPPSLGSMLAGTRGVGRQRSVGLSKLSSRGQRSSGGSTHSTGSKGRKGTTGLDSTKKPTSTTGFTSTSGSGGRRRWRRRRPRHGLDDLREVLVMGPRHNAGRHPSMERWHRLE